MRISDWSSDVCSSDLLLLRLLSHPQTPLQIFRLFSYRTCCTAPYRNERSFRYVNVTDKVVHAQSKDNRDLGDGFCSRAYGLWSDLSASFLAARGRPRAAADRACHSADQLYRHESGLEDLA